MPPIAAKSADSPGPTPTERRGLPFYIRVLIGVALGTIFGMVAQRTLLPVATLGDLGMLVITLLKTLATPLILFAVLDAFLRTRIPARKGAKLIAFSLVNALVAICIGLGLATVLHAGDAWKGKMDEIRRTRSVQSAKLTFVNLPGR